jgi:hypothetical protein
MTAAARSFVEKWIREHVRPQPGEDHHFQLQSCADAIACVHSAMAFGIKREDIRAVHGDLVSHIAAERQRMLHVSEMAGMAIGAASLISESR